MTGLGLVIALTVFAGGESAAVPSAILVATLLLL